MTFIYLILPNSGHFIPPQWSTATVKQHVPDIINRPHSSVCRVSDISAEGRMFELLADRAFFMTTTSSIEVARTLL